MRGASMGWSREIDRRRVIRAGGGAVLGAGLLRSGAGLASAARQASPAGITPGADWSAFQGGPARTGLAADNGPAGEPELLWRFESGMTGAIASPLVVDGLVLFTASAFGGSAVIALDPATGQNAWEAPFPFQPFGSTPAVADGLIFIVGMHGEATAIDLTTQQPLWEATIGADVSSSPLVFDGLLYIAATDDHLIALDINDGSERWRFQAGEGGGYTLGPSPSAADGVVYVASASTSGDGRLYALDADTGEEIWSVEPDDPGLYTPAIADGTLYVGGDGGSLYALDAASGEERWKAEVGSVWSTPAVSADAVLVQTMDGILACRDRTSGELLWQAESPASWCSPVVAGETVYVGAQGLWFEQGLYALDFASGEQRWYMRIASVTAPVTSSGDLLFVADDDGALCAIRGSRGDAVERGTNGEGAFLTPLVFSTEVDAANLPIDPSDTLPAGSTKVIAGFDHVGLEYEAAWEAVWTLDGAPLTTREAVWQGGTGRVIEELSANEGALPSGRYGLELRVDGIPIRRGEVAVA